MIFDKLQRTPRYTGLSRNLARALEYLASNDFSQTPVGKIELDGDSLYAIVQTYTTKPLEQGAWEAHRRYIDVQYLVSGRERIFFSPLERMQVGSYVSERDFLPMAGTGTALELTAGFFAIFHPEDAHMPGLAFEDPEPVKKVVVKVAVD